MSNYLIYILGTTAAAFTLFLLLYIVRHDRKGAVTALAALPLCVILGFALAKLSYVILMEIGSIIEWGEWDSLFDMRPKTFCFVGGAAGV